MSTEDVKTVLSASKSGMDMKMITKPPSKRKRDSTASELETGRKTQRRNSLHTRGSESCSPPPGQQPQDQPGFFTLGTPDSSQREATAAQAIQAEAILADEHVAPQSGHFRGVNQGIDNEAVDNEEEEEEPRQSLLAPGPDVSSGDFLRPHPIGPPVAKDKKAAVGSEEWHKHRKDSHKEVERKRRETINDGINAISKLLPQRNEKNKGQILQNAAEYIVEVETQKNSMLDKWTSEKLIVDEAIRSLEQRLEHMHKTSEAWKACARNAGVDVDEYDLGIPQSQFSGVHVPELVRKQEDVRLRESMSGGTGNGRANEFGALDHGMQEPGA